MKNTKKIFAFILIISLLFVNSYAASIYAPDGRNAIVDDNEVAAYEAVGWYRYPVVAMYAYDGRCIVVSKASVADWEAVGWIDGSKTITVYSLDGREAKIPQWQVYSYETVGWYSYPFVIVDARSWGTMKPFIVSIKYANYFNKYGASVCPITNSSMIDNNDFICNLNWKILNGDFSDYEGKWTDGNGYYMYLDADGKFSCDINDNSVVLNVSKNFDGSYLWTFPNFNAGNILYPIGVDVIAFDGSIVYTDTSKPRLWRGNGEVTHNSMFYYYIGK